MPSDLITIDYMKSVSEFIQFISLRSHAIEDVLRFLTFDTFKELKATGVMITELESSGSLMVNGLFGFDTSVFGKFPDEIKISDPHPIPEVLRLRRMVWINTLPEWPDEYPNMKMSKFPNKEKTVINMPIDKFGTPVACMTIFSTECIEPDAEIQAYLRAVGSVFSLYLFRDDLDERIRQAAEEIVSTRANSIRVKSSPEKLSDRQTVILKLISSGMTNIQISEHIGYSESTVRQETIKIFAVLGCANRYEAARIYRDSIAADGEFAS